jgi:hypothetical protein
MQKLKYSLLSVLMMMLAFSCADEPLPFDTFEDYAKGGFSRLLSTDGGTFFFTDPDNSAFTFDVEYYSENNGGDIAGHEWSVRHRNNVSGDISDPAILANITSSAFGTDPKSGLPSASFAFSMNDAMAALGKTIDDFNGGDDLVFDGVIIMNDGRRFGPDNTGGSVNGGAGFDGIFRFIKPLLCPSELQGWYTAVATNTSQGAGIGWDGCAGNTWEGDLEIVALGDGEYTVRTIAAAGDTLDDMSFGNFYSCYGSTSQGSMPNSDTEMLTLTIVDACNVLSFRGSSQWGEVYTFNEINPNGADLTLGWTNDYGEGGSTVITRTDGSSWPTLK